MDAPSDPGGGQLENVRGIHLIGIGGSGMSSLAALLAGQGKQVSGSDLSADAVTRLNRHNLEVRPGHSAENVGAAQVVIHSAAISPDNVELVEARRRGLVILSHAQALGELMRSKIGLAVAGTHGKTTTTAMLGFILEQAGLDPTVLVGATAVDFGSGMRSGKGPHLVVEADEYERRFLTLTPHVAIITSIEADHLDSFMDLAEIVGAFQEFTRRLATDGVLVTCADDSVLAQTSFAARRLTYGWERPADWRLSDYQPRVGGGCGFALHGPPGQVTLNLRLSGRHNAANAAGALAAAAVVGVSATEAAEALAGFNGTERRFETVLRENNIWIVDDYAHHPTAVRATLEAARAAHPGRLWAVFQPHTTNRLASMLEEFAPSFSSADLLTLLPVYRPPGREPTGRQIDSGALATRISQPPTRLAESLEAAERELANELRPGDLAVIMGAGDSTKLAHSLAERLASRSAV